MTAAVDYLRDILDAVNQRILVERQILADALEVVGITDDDGNREAAWKRFHGARTEIVHLESRLVSGSALEAVGRLGEADRRKLINEIYWTRWGVTTRLLGRMFDNPTTGFHVSLVRRPGRVPHRCLRCGRLARTIVAGRAKVTEMIAAGCRVCGGILEVDYAGITLAEIDYTR